VLREHLEQALASTRRKRGGRAQRLSRPPAVPIDVTVQYLASALVGVLTWWLDSGMPHKPEQMDRMSCV